MPKPRPSRATSRSKHWYRRPWLRRLLIGTTAITGMALALLAGYLIHLDNIITNTFEGRRWSVPAVVYAQPVELYPGAKLRLAAVISELDRLGYRQRGELSDPGTYKRTDNRLGIHLRGFHFMERRRHTQRVELEFGPAGSGISNISDPNGRPIPLIRLDPLNIGSFFPSHGEDRIVLPPDLVPELLSEALKAVEDQNFDRHVGFDVRGILRAIWVNVKSGELRQGGSTLTQQLVRSYYLDNRRTLARKLNEVAMAVILEARFEKADLLNAYVNEIYLGQDGGRAVHGFGLGAQFYFNKPLAELGSHEIATLIAIIRGPSYYHPLRHPERTHKRRDMVLDKMLDRGLIDTAEHERATNKEFRVAQGTRIGGAYYPAFMDLVRERLKENYADDQLTTQGLRVFTTLVPRIQDALEQGIADTLTRIEQTRLLTPDALQAAAVITSTQTGDVLALSGGRAAGFAGFNRALHARRQVGSLIKPVIYLTALESGYHLGSRLLDAPVQIPLPNQPDWAPENFSGEAHGEVPLIRALGDSMNLATVRLGLDLGIVRVAGRLESLAGQAPENVYPSLLLGAEALSPLAVTTLYGVFASGGFRLPPSAVIAVLDGSGAPLSRHRIQLQQRIDNEHVNNLNRALGAAMRYGTGRSSRFSDLSIAGKTGTSDDYRDSWFAGFDNNKLGVVWVGHDDNSPTGLTGAAGALKVWDAVMAKLALTPMSHAFSGEVTTIDYQTGLLARAECADVVEIPTPEESLQELPGCGISSPSLSDKVRGWFETR